MKHFLAFVAIILSCGSWLPMWFRAVRTKRTVDYSLPAMSMVLGAQVINLSIAVMDHSPTLLRYFIGNGILVSISLAIVIWYRR